MIPDLVVLGNLLVDDVVLPDGRTRMAEPGGSTLHAALGAALWGVRTGIVSWRGTDYPQWALDALAARGIDLTGVHDLGRPGVRTWLLYEGRRRQVVLRLDVPSHADVSPTFAQIPQPWLAARSFHVAPMPFEIQRSLVAALSALPAAFVSLDPYLPLDATTLADWRGLIASVDAFLLSEDELAPGGDERAVIRSLASGRLRYIAYKRGATGGLLYDARDDSFSEWSAQAPTIVDATGAGDAFANGLLAGWLLGDVTNRALERGIVSASFALEDWGPAGLLSATPEQAEARRRTWFGA